MTRRRLRRCTPRILCFVDGTMGEDDLMSSAPAMSGLGFERTTQDRVLKQFQEQLGYRYFGDWKPQV